MFKLAYMFQGGYEPLILDWPVGTSAIKKGQVVALSGGLAVPATAGQAAGTVLGVATSDGEANGTVKVIVSRDTVYEVKYKKGTKTSLSNSDLGTAFDIYVDGTTGDMLINLDDTTGGFCKVIKYDNEREVAYVLIGNRVF